MKAPVLSPCLGVPDTQAAVGFYETLGPGGESARLRGGVATGPRGRQSEPPERKKPKRPPTCSRCAQPLPATTPTP